MRDIKNIFSLLCLLVFSITLISAYNQGDTINITQGCVNSTYSNISAIFLEDGSQTFFVKSEQSMNEVSNDFYEYYFNDTLILGNYRIIGHCDIDGVDTQFAPSFRIGEEFTGSKISIYIFFFLLCLLLTFFSFKLVVNNPMSKDPITNSKLYEIKKRNEFLYFITVLKTKMYIVGLFGIYLSILLFSALLNNLVYNMGLNDLNIVLGNINMILLWGLLVFVIFWLCYLIITFYRTTVDVMRYQFGGFLREDRQ